MLDGWELILRLGVAQMVGGLVGLERQLSGKPAGLRTHMLVSLGAALFMVSALQLTPPNEQYQSASRVIQGIVTGIGFLGAAEVLRLSGSHLVGTHGAPGQVPILGLTSAAAVWVSAALGAAAGSGLWMTALVGALMTLLILSILRWVEQKVFGLGSAGGIYPDPYPKRKPDRYPERKEDQGL